VEYLLAAESFGFHGKESALAMEGILEIENQDAH
jgi:hypothetical protein